jgi:hypothetical protein
MSHFSVLVIGPHDSVDDQLAPYHEFETTGNNDQFVQDLDITEAKRSEFKEDRRSMLKLADGELVSHYDDRFYRDPSAEELRKAGPLGFMGTGFGNGISWTSKDWGDGRGHRGKIRFTPEGAEEVELPYENFAEWLDYELLGPGESPDLSGKHRYGYAVLNSEGEVVQVIKRTNPSAKWDWWTIGGRWDGQLEGKNQCLKEELTAPPEATFAVIYNGQWYGRGEMGWWGCVSNEKDKDQWHEEFRKLLEGLPPETPLTVVDCHI